MERPRRFASDPADGDPLVHDVLVGEGWQPTAVEAGDWSLLWSVGEPSAATYAQLRADQQVSHFPGIAALVRKDRLAETLKRATIEEIAPETFALPGELARFRARSAAAPELLWIQKPNAGARGEGVSVLTSPDELETGGNWLVQRYLDRPHLIDGRKYTLRWYVLVTALEPLTAWVFDDGFTKLASRAFSTDRAGLGDPFRHLTNPDVQALNPDVATSADNLTRPAYADLLRAEGADPEALFERIELLLAATLGAARDELARTTWRSTNNPPGCFELLGFDLLVDADLRPWLLECNLNPSLSVEAEPDAGESRAEREERELKHDLVREVLRVAGLTEAGGGGRSFRQLLPSSALAGVLALPRPGDTGEPVRLRRAAGISQIPVGDGLVLHDGHAQRAHLLDPVGAYIWAAWSEGLAVEEIAAELSESLPESAWRAATDVRNALAEWFELGLAVTTDPERTAEHAPVPRLRWNRERAYRCGSRVAVVLVPDDEVERWLDVSLAGFRDDDAEAVDLRIEVGRSRTGRDVTVADERYACRSARQLGPVVRGVVLRRLGGDAFAGTLLTEEGGTVLVLGPAALRAELAESWLRDGGTCAGDDLFRLDADGLVAGELIGIEAVDGATWWGDLPGLADPRPMLLTEHGQFARMWRPDGAQAGRVRPARILSLAAPSTKGALLAATPASPEDAFRDLLGSCYGEGRLGRESAERIAELATNVPAHRLLIPDASVGRGVLSAFPEPW
jgi:tubulin polyglutamylase TTLL5